MALKTCVKAGSITNLSDARYFSALGVEWIGFTFEQDLPKAIAPDTVYEMLEWIYGPTITGEFHSKPMREVNHLVDYLSLQALQLGPAYTQQHCYEATVPVIKELQISKQTTADSIADEFAHFYGSASYFLLNGRNNGIDWEQLQNGSPISTDQLRELCQQFFIVLDVNLSAATVLDVLEEVQPAGINLIGGEETEVGVKTFDDLDAVMEKLEIED